MACTCTKCPECNGTGEAWVSSDGKYLGRARIDDMDDLDTCVVCHGDGFLDCCDECRCTYEDEDEMDHRMVDENYR